MKDKMHQKGNDVLPFFVAPQIIHDTETGITGRGYIP